MIDSMTRTRFRANEPSVVYELFDDEVVVVNLDSGNYYSLEHEAADVWRGVVSGLEPAALASLLAARYTTDAAALAILIQPFIDELVAEGLLVDAQVQPTQLPELQLPTPGAPRPFGRPTFSRYTDMQQLLLLDPIHEVDASGWPHAKPE